jgi:hypothetical protein
LGVVITVTGSPRVESFTFPGTLANNQVDDQTLQLLADHREGIGRDVESFSFQHSRITDTELRHLTAFHFLKELEIDSPYITDAGLKELKNWGQCRRIALINTKISDAGFLELQKALPRTKLEHRP